MPIRFHHSSISHRCQRRKCALVEKTQAGRKAARTAIMIQGAAKALEKGVIADLVTGLAVFKRRINRDKIATLVGQGKSREAMEVIPWEKLPEDLRKIPDKLERGFLSAATRSTLRLPRPAQKLRFDTANPRVRQTIEGQTGLLIRDIEETTRQAVSTAMSRSFDQGLTPKRTASLVRENVGLTEKQTMRVFAKAEKERRTREILQQELRSLVNQGKGTAADAMRKRAKLRLLTDNMIDMRAERFANQLQKQRSVAIARSELTRAVNNGQMEVWDQAAEQGLIERQKAKKVWVSTLDNDTSEICEGLDGTSVPLDGEFFIEQTGEQVKGPPGHPNCRGALALEME